MQNGHCWPHKVRIGPTIAPQELRPLYSSRTTSKDKAQLCQGLIKTGKNSIHKQWSGTLLSPFPLQLRVDVQTAASCSCVSLRAHLTFCHVSLPASTVLSRLDLVSDISES